ncbi:hypothetical protein ACPPVU_02500 [Mucilaginibacter sp. McL0603]|uniref:hypothetical protein n=1 Tax=Mucilaginibacter sp. McL0603 TaxID=3415670 RepID=UPI003CFA8F68
MKTAIIAIICLLAIGLAIVVFKISTAKHIKVFGIEAYDDDNKKSVDTLKKQPLLINKPHTNKPNPELNKPTKDKSQIRYVRLKSIPNTEISSKKNDTASKSKYDLSHATVDHSAVGDNAKVENFNGIKPRHLDSVMFFSLLKRINKFWDEHPKAERNLVEVNASPDKDSRQLADDLIFELKHFDFKVTNGFVPLTPIQSNGNENFMVGTSVDNKNLMVTVMEQPNVK